MKYSGTLTLITKYKGKGLIKQVCYKGVHYMGVLFHTFTVTSAFGAEEHFHYTGDVDFITKGFVISGFHCIQSQLNIIDIS